MSVDKAALVAGGIRLASGVHFLADPVGANKPWGEPDGPGPSARLLLRSMGYRDALIGRTVGGDPAAQRRAAGSL